MLLKLGPFGQIHSMRTYTILTLIFPLNDENQDNAISTLEKAANEIVLSYPWLAGQVVTKIPENEEKISSGINSIVEYEPHSGHSKFVLVKDCRDICASYAEITKARAPSSMLDGSIISPAYGFPALYPTNVPQPVILMQANFIKGGLLLTVCGHHAVMDANGNEQFMRQFATLCQGGKLSPEHVRMGNIDQDTIVPPLEFGVAPTNLDIASAPSSLNAPPGAWPLPPSVGLWKYVRFPASSIAALKIEASKNIDLNSDVKYISSNDAVSSFIWERLMAVRSIKLPKDSTTTLTRAVNSRKRLNSPVSEGYMGHFIVCKSTTLPLDSVKDHSHFSQTTITARRSLLDVNDHHVRSFFALLKSKKDFTTVNYGANFNPETDVMLTSFAAQRLYNTSFGDLLGQPTFVRRPSLPDCPSLFYMMPTNREGDIDVDMSLLTDDFEGLKADELWTKYTEAID